MTSTAAVDAVATTLAIHPAVATIALGGSRATGRGDDASDHDIYVFGNDEIPLDLRRELALRFDHAPEIGTTWFGPSDSWIARGTGAVIDIVYFERAWFEGTIRDVIERHQPALGYTTAFWHTLRNLQPLFDREGWLATMQALAASPYPAELRRNIVAWNHPLLRTTRFSWRHQIEIAIQRDDPVSVNHRVAALLASVFDIVFAVHRELHPGEKRLLDHLATLGEDEIARRVRVLLRAAGAPDGDGVLAAVDALCDAIDDAIRDAGLWNATRRPES